MQLSHYNTKFSRKRFPIIVVSDNVTNELNIGGLFRIADAFGVDRIIFCGEQIEIGRKTQRTSRSTEKTIPYEISNSIDNVINTLKLEGYQILTLEITEQSIPIHSFNVNKHKPIVLVIGDENFGVSDTVLNNSDTIIHIDMFGENSSMNVVQASNIALYEITKQLI